MHRPAEGPINKFRSRATPGTHRLRLPATLGTHLGSLGQMVTLRVHHLQRYIPRPEHAQQFKLCTCHALLAARLRAMIDLLQYVGSAVRDGHFFPVS